jgi:SulP family sulfate permease
MVLAAMLFIKRSIDLTETRLWMPDEHIFPHEVEVSDDIAVYDVNGPLFFGAAHKALKILRHVDRRVRVVILDMRDVSMMDMTAIVVLESILRQFERDGIPLVINGLEPRLLLKLLRAGFLLLNARIEFGRTFADRVERARRLKARTETLATS